MWLDGTVLKKRFREKYGCQALRNSEDNNKIYIYICFLNHQVNICALFVKIKTGKANLCCFDLLWSSKGIEFGGLDALKHVEIVSSMSSLCFPLV